ARPIQRLSEEVLRRLRDCRSALQQEEFALEAQQLGRDPAFFGPLDSCFDQRERLGDPPGVSQGRRQLTQKDQQAEVGLGGLVRAGRQSQSCVEIATLEYDNFSKRSTMLARDRQTMLSRIIEQHFRTAVLVVAAGRSSRQT